MLQENYELLISEKPTSAKKIAEALAEGKVIKHTKDKVNYYEIAHNNKKIIVASAVGHLFGLKSTEKGWTYPIFNYEWKRVDQISKTAAFAKKYIDLLESLSKNAGDITICTDFDVEGEVIGLNIVRFIAKRKDAKRMKFSTLTQEELQEAYKNASPNLIWPQAEAGETRHSLDWLVGINISRALSLSIKAADSFKIMSAGRVQGPTLNLLTQREKEIKKFVSEPFWLVELQTDKLNAWHKQDKFWKKREAESIIKKLTNKTPRIQEIKTTIKKQAPPTPFDLTSLQIESYRQFRITPKQTLQIAQNLYTKGYISYPRTSSQKLPPSLGYTKILTKLSKQEQYAALVKILPKNLKPNEGKKSDPAHPAIYPTGEIGKLTERDAKLYDLIVHRFLATFGTIAKRETMSIMIDVDNETFVTSGTRTIEKGWHVLYGKYAKFSEEELPNLEKDQILENKGIILHAKETQPPKRYTQASIIKELEEKSLGTKATRAQIVDSLYQRDYIIEKSIEVTDLGLKTNDTLKKYVPEILDEALTRQFEEEMEQIREGKKKKEEILKKAIKFVNDFSIHFKENEKHIGKELLEAIKETRTQASLVGKCPNCKEGLLNLVKGKFGIFVSCDHYETCGTTFSIPKGALVRVTKQICDSCQYPKISIIKQGKRPIELCINKECSTKKSDIVLEKNKICPECKGKLVIRKSIYNSFIGCENYPKCKYIENNNNKKREKLQPKMQEA